MSAQDATAPTRPAAGLAIAALLALVAWLTYRPFLGLAFVGLDTWPMIAASRIASFADLLGTFTEELMDGYYTDGHFYRPVTNLAFALNHALFGVEPRGWHLTDLAILVGNALLVRAVGLRLFGSRWQVGAACAALVIVLHPVQIEILPVPARRADTLCLLFLCASWLALPRPGAGEARRRLRAVCAGLLVVCAVAAKETGAVALPLAFAWQACARRSAGEAWGQGARGALRDILPALVLFALFLAARTAVLGGLGGHDEGAASMLRAEGLFAFLEGYFGRVAYPQPFLGTSLLSARLFLGAALLVLLLGGAASLAPSAESGRSRAPALAFLAVWVSGLLAMSSLAGRIHDWYAMLFVAPYAILLGCGLQYGVDALRRGKRVAGALLAAGALALVATHIAHAPIVRPYPMWSRGGSIASEFLTRYAAAVRAATPGERVVLEGFVPYLPPNPNGTGIRSAFLLGEYSVQAWSDLMLPEHPVHVDLFTGGTPPPPPQSAAESVHVLLVPGRPR